MGKTHRYERGGVKKPKFDRNKKKKSKAFSEEDEESEEGQFDPIHKNNDPIKELWEVVDHESDSF